MKRFNSEAEMAAVVVAWLRDLKFEVYQEVQNTWGRADIVAVSGPIVWVIETKMSLGFDVFDQALRYTRDANYVSVATPSHTNRRVVSELCRTTGIGVLQVYGSTVDCVSEKIPARFFRCKGGSPLNVRSHLRDEQKTWGEAGTQDNYYTPFKQTCLNISRFVARNNGCTLKEMMEAVDMHYKTVSTARGLIPKYIDMGLVPGVTLDRSGKALRLIYTTPSDKSRDAA